MFSPPHPPWFNHPNNIHFHILPISSHVTASYKKDFVRKEDFDAIS
jgi:hypothetical protein